MIGKLRGIVDSQGEDHVILDVHGVGYMVHCSARTLQALPQAGETATLAIETVVREDMIRLYGFRSEAEREYFRLLQTVQGVGAKVALGILTALDPAALTAAIARADKTALARAPGVGPRLAVRIATELKDKAPVFVPMPGGPAAPLSPAVADDAPQPLADAVSALVNLGYGEPQAARAVSAAVEQAGEGADVARLIRLALRELAS
ncbi:Holliday junction DNA helicase RuvA [Pseudochelatococcus lubricantis]|uniref:Holliday junction branch migration complex subunit RuvA n=1 Tax=Pseudochelatococcus lubricantis TaxID=1538102 RepID=A0ABX0V6P8_9HYPH|nr:Holliday junction branch migration protein RuvA [Pseudochelatococcus lubricantis]NIJ59455.1 Holliday junction DNA helicase RuvA [Pseudochelatococcus lubricantis]